MVLPLVTAVKLLRILLRLASAVCNLCGVLAASSYAEARRCGVKSPYTTVLFFLPSYKYSFSQLQSPKSCH